MDPFEGSNYLVERMDQASWGAHKGQGHQLPCVQFTCTSWHLVPVTKWAQQAGTEDGHEGSYPGNATHRCRIWYVIRTIYDSDTSANPVEGHRKPRIAKKRFVKFLSSPKLFAAAMHLLERTTNPSSSSIGLIIQSAVVYGKTDSLFDKNKVIVIII